MATAASNPFLLAVDKPKQLITLLRENPELASEQDVHGYSLLHAAASYNQLDLLRTLVQEFHVDVNLKDEDGETALFVCETTECAKILVEELHADTTIRGDEGQTAREKFVADEEFPEVAVYLMVHEFGGAVDETKAASATNVIGPAPRLPEGLSIDVGTMAPEDIGGEAPDPEFRRRIEELAARGDFDGETGQAELRQLVTEALRGQMVEEREVKRRTD